MPTLSVQLILYPLNTWNFIHFAHNDTEKIKYPLYGPTYSGATPLLSAEDSTLQTNKDVFLEKSSEDFNSVLNRPSSVNGNAIKRLQQTECNVPLDEFPTVTETRKEIHHLSSGKAPSADAIPVEAYKAGG